MTREEVISLLKYVRNAYPNQRLEDAKGTANIWEGAFANEDARIVFRAARIHVENSPYFPAPANIKNLMVRASLLIELEAEQAEQRKLEGPQAPNVLIPAVGGSCPLNDHECVLYNDLCYGPNDRGLCPFEDL